MAHHEHEDDAQDVVADAQALYDVLRSHGLPLGSVDLKAVREAADAVDVDLTPEVWSVIRDHLPGDLSLPPHLTAFLARYAASLAPSRVLNLWASDGELARAITRTTPKANIIAVEPNSTKADFGRYFSERLSVEWHLGRLSRMGEVPGADYDLVISAAPFGIKDSLTMRPKDGRQVSITDDEGRLDLLRCAPLVTAHGEAVLLTASSLLLPGRARKTLEALADNGLWLKAAFSVPAGTFAPVTSISAVIAVFSRERHDDVFLAELPRDERAQAQLVTRMQSRKPGKTISAGVLLKMDKLQPLETVLARADAERGLEATGVPKFALEDVALAFNRPFETEGRLGFEDKPNCLYLPLVGHGPARLQAPEKISKEWVQIELDPERALSEYLAGWLSSKLGKRTRESLAAGAYIERTSISNIRQLPVPLPPIVEQDTALSVASQLIALSAQAQALVDDMWTKPSRIRDIARQVRRLSPSDDVSTWIEALPLPLATVGRAYYTRENVRERIEALFNFFEATAEFQATVLLSAFSSDSKYFEQAQDDLLGPVEDRQRYFEKTSVGGWTVLATRLAKELRRMMSMKDAGSTVGRETVFQWFGRPDPEWLEMMTNPAVYTTLDEAARR